MPCRKLLDRFIEIRYQGISWAALPPYRLPTRSFRIEHPSLRWRGCSSPGAGLDHRATTNAVPKGAAFLDRGFIESGAETFLRVFDDTMRFAGLSDADTVLPSQTERDEMSTSPESSQSRESESATKGYESKFFQPKPVDAPFSERLQITLLGGGRVKILADLKSAQELDAALGALQAIRPFLASDPEASDVAS